MSGITTDSEEGKIVGGTTDTVIGNNGDRLLVDAITTSDVTPSQNVVHFSDHLVNATSRDMNVDGSTTEVEFSIGPASGTTWYVFEYGISIDDNGNNTLDTFGAVSGPLTNGVLIEQQVSSTDYQFEVLKNNLDIVEVFTDHFIRGQANAYLNASNFFSGKIELRVPVTLNGTNGDKIKVTIRDDLTGLSTLHFNVEGYKVI